MKRRTRPLDPAEYRSVPQNAAFPIEALEDFEEYVLKWPKSPLAQLAASSSNAGGGLGVDDPFAVKTEPVIPVNLSAPRPVTGPSLADGATMVLNDNWRHDLSGYFNSVGGDTPKSRQNVVSQIVALEAKLHEQQRKLAGAVQRLMSLTQALPLSRLNSDTNGSALVVDSVVYDKWCREHQATATTDRPWGFPVVGSFLECGPRDEYFVPCDTTDVTVQSASTAARTSSSSTNFLEPGHPLLTVARHHAMGQRAPATRARQTSNLLKSSDHSYLPYKLPDQVADLLNRKEGVPPRELASAFPSFEKTKSQLRPLAVYLGDLEAEIAECEKWYDSEVTGPFSSSMN
jgi:hypothetical protein